MKEIYIRYFYFAFIVRSVLPAYFPLIHSGNTTRSLCQRRSQINFPVLLSEESFTSSGVPAATILPPSAPPPGPISTI